MNAACHVDRPNRSRGLCTTCYAKWVRKPERHPFLTAIVVRNPSRTARTGGAENRRLRSLYGITIEERAEMARVQDGKCAICLEKRKLVIDHNHTTSVVRGLLCQRCNVFLGMIETGPAHLIESARDYLRCYP